ncbi:hypothetical protein HDU85_001514 [Gaertneriomyces sp. JEL0708]|nr:hypothetical protein HDU85_001514 [Gaertneriomyces sp. JEL0708]
MSSSSQQQQHPLPFVQGIKLSPQPLYKPSQISVNPASPTTHPNDATTTATTTNAATVESNTTVDVVEDPSSDARPLTMPVFKEELLNDQDYIRAESERRLLAHRAEHLKAKLRRQNASYSGNATHHHHPAADHHDEGDIAEMWAHLCKNNDSAFPLDDPAVAEAVFRQLDWAPPAHSRGKEWISDAGYDSGSECAAIEALDTYSVVAGMPRATKSFQARVHALLYGGSNSTTKNSKVAWRPTHSQQKQKAPLVPRAAHRPSKKTTSQKRLERELAQREAHLYAMQERGFKANPVPASSILPKYGKISAKWATHKKDTRPSTPIITTSKKESPFLSGWGDAACGCKPHDTTQTLEQVLDRAVPPTASSSRPTSKNGPSPSDSEKKGPPKIIAEAAEDGRRRLHTLQQNELRAGLTSEHTFHPVIGSGDIPPYQKLQHAFESKLQDRRKEFVPTIPARHQHPPRPPAARPPTSPPKLTHSYTLKVTHRKQQEEERVRREEEEKRKEQAWRDSQKKTKDVIRTRMAVLVQARTSLHTAESERKLREQKQLQKQRDEAYRSEVEAMKKKLEMRPYLFEMSDVENAKKGAAKAFDEMMRRSGVDMEELGI